MPYAHRRAFNHDVLAEAAILTDIYNATAVESSESESEDERSFYNALRLSQSSFATPAFRLRRLSQARAAPVSTSALSPCRFLRVGRRVQSNTLCCSLDFPQNLPHFK